MNQVVMAPILQPPETADALRGDPAKFSIVGGLLYDVLRASAPADPLLAMMEAVGRKAQAAGLTEADVDAELAAWNTACRT
jgi:hypothetical protein